MKTQIVQIEPYDDYISVRDRMEWGQTTRVLLVWPKRGDILYRRLDLTLIKRHSIALGSQLALVTRNRKIRYQADQLNIPVYRSVREAEQSLWRRPRKRQKSIRAKKIPLANSKERIKPDLSAMRAQAHPTSPKWLIHPIARISIFTIGVMSMLVVAAIFIPSATIYVTPAIKTETVTIDVIASTDQKTVELSGAVPAYIESILVEGRGSTPATGETIIPRQKAIGSVTFVNLTEEAIDVSTGTVVSTQDEPPIRFATTQTIIVPTGTQGKTAPIEAILPGTDGNILAEKIVAIEGPLGLNLSVTNRRRTSGGTNFTAVTPSEDDYQAVYDDLLTSLQKTAYTEFEFNASPGDMLLSTVPLDQRITEESYIPEVGKPADFLELNLQAEFMFPYASGEDLNQLGRIVLDRHITNEFTPRQETIQINQLTKPTSQLNGSAAWRMQASWQMEAELDETLAIALILGLEPEQALQELDEHTSTEPGKIINLTPEWWPRLPMLPFRINIVNMLDTTPEQLQYTFNLLGTDTE